MLRLSIIAAVLLAAAGIAGAQSYLPSGNAVSATACGASQFDHTVACDAWLVPVIGP